MSLAKNELVKILDNLYLLDEIKLADIPEIELYMDQLLFFLNSKLEPFKREAAEKILTKTMINNYTKDQLLAPPKNKKYSKEHIMLLILVYQLKNVLSINDIKQLFSPIIKDISTPDDDVIPLTDIYETYLALKKEQVNEFHNNFTDKFAAISAKTSTIEGQTNRDMAELFLTVLTLVAEADASKRLAEKIIDNFFSNPEL